MSIQIAEQDECDWHPDKGLWQTPPDSWIERRFMWIQIAFPYATDLIRGVAHSVFQRVL